MAAGNADERAFALAARNAGALANDTAVASAKGVADAARSAAKTAADDAIVTERAARVSAEAAERTHAVAARLAASSARDTAIADAAAARTVARDAAKLASDNAIIAERALRVAAEEANALSIATFLGAPSLALDTLSEVIAAYTAGDSTLQGAVDALVIEHNSELAAETAARILDVNTEETRALAAEAFVQADVDANEVASDASFAAAATARGLMQDAAAAIQADVDANQAAEEARMDKAGGFAVSSLAGAYAIQWAAGGPRMSFAIDAVSGVVTMSVDTVPVV